MCQIEAQVKKSGQKPCDDEKSCTFAADISRESGTTIRQVRAEAYRFSTTAARISRQIYLFAYLYFDLIVKITAIDEVGDGELGVVVNSNAKVYQVII